MLPDLLLLTPPPLGSVRLEPMAPMRSSLFMASTVEMLKVRLRFTPADRLDRNLLLSFCAEWNRDDSFGLEACLRDRGVSPACTVQDRLEGAWAVSFHLVFHRW